MCRGSSPLPHSGSQDAGRRVFGHIMSPELRASDMHQRKWLMKSRALTLMAALLFSLVAVAQDSQPPAASTQNTADKPVEQKKEVDVKPGSKDDVEAIGNRKMGGKGLGNWYSLEREIRMVKEYAAQIESSVKLVQDPVVSEYVNRIGQNLVRNSDAKVRHY